MAMKDEILERMSLYRLNDGGIGSWLSASTCDSVFDRLATIDRDPLSPVQLNQLLVLAHEAPVSDGFFQYYWGGNVPARHPYRITDLPEFRVTWNAAKAITSLDHLAWGLHRLYIDGLLYFGNIRAAFRKLRDYSFDELTQFFSQKRFDTEAIKRRGEALPLKHIPPGKRYLVSEMACKSYGENPAATSQLKRALDAAYSAHLRAGGGEISVEGLLRAHLPEEFKSSEYALHFSACEISDRRVNSEEDIEDYYGAVARAFDEVRANALKNTQYYLSMLTDLDVYVATSMRSRENFLSMAQICERIFTDQNLSALNLRYFDPTLSAAEGHEDKGLVECLMVKCAKALVYCAGDQESFGKDAEAAMALSLGRPVIFYCEQRQDLYRNVHPLARLIQFDTGIAVGAMVADTLEKVVQIIARTFENRMLYRLERSSNGSLRLREQVSESVVRLQTSNKLLTETFWNHYHRPEKPAPKREALIGHEVGEEANRSLPEESVAPRWSGHLRLVQPQLPLEDIQNAIPIAARAAASPSPIPVNAATRKSIGDEFLLSISELFDGIASEKRSGKTGAKRFEVFSQWSKENAVAPREIVRLLRFIEGTLAEHRTKSGFVYQSSDLSRWYAEMSNGSVSGTPR